MDVNGQRSIVVGTDGSQRSIAAVRWAMDEARATDGKVKVVVAWEVPTSILITPTFVDSDYRDYAAKVLEDVLAEVGAEESGVPVEASLVMGTGGYALVHESSDADLLVVGSHGLGHGKLPGLHLGSVTSYCMHHAKCPTVVVRT